MKYPLHFVVSYVQLVTQHYESRTVQKAPLKVATMKNTDDFCYKGNPSHATTKSALFAVSKDEWDTKEDTGKSMKNALYVLQYAKRHLSGRSDVKQWKDQARSLSRYRVTLVWRHISQSVSRKFRFRLTNTALSSPGKSETVFCIIFFIGHTHSFVVPTIQYYHTVWYHVLFHWNQHIQGYNRNIIFLLCL